MDNFPIEPDDDRQIGRGLVIVVLGGMIVGSLLGALIVWMIVS